MERTCQVGSTHKFCMSVSFSERIVTELSLSYRNCFYMNVTAKGLWSLFIATKFLFYRGVKKCDTKEKERLFVYRESSESAAVSVNESCEDARRRSTVCRKRRWSAPPDCCTSLNDTPRHHGDVSSSNQMYDSNVASRPKWRINSSVDGCRHDSRILRYLHGGVIDRLHNYSVSLCLYL